MKIYTNKINTFSKFKIKRLLKIQDKEKKSILSFWNKQALNYNNKFKR